MKNAYNIFIWFSLLIAFLLILLLGFWSIYPYKTIEFNKNSGLIQNLDKTVKRGDRVRYLIDYCKFTDEIPTITKFFIDGVIYETPKTIGVADKGCRVEISDAYVPKAIPEGSYSLKIVATYKVNPIRTIQVVSHTENFFVK